MNLQNLFQRKQKVESAPLSTSNVEVVFFNDAVPIIEKCCRCCVNSKSSDDYDTQIEYIQKRIKIHHESILEHSNLVLRINREAIDVREYDSIISSVQYLRVVKDSTYIYIGGSIRGWKDFLKRVNLDDPLPSEILECLEMYIPRCLMVDMIDEGFAGMNEWTFPERVTDMRYESEFEDDNDHEFKPFINNTGEAWVIPQFGKSTAGEKGVECINFDVFSSRDLNYDRWVIGKDGSEHDNFFHSDMKLMDFLRLGTCTFNFKNMSRAATHQLVRHRNGITQESQRYVNYKDAGFNIPKSFEKVNAVNIGGKAYSINQMFKLFTGIYDALIAQGVPKEDARAVLPNATECGQLYMTFTWYNLCMFLMLRMDKAAQSEIRGYATAVYNLVHEDLDYILADWETDLDTVIANMQNWHQVENNPELNGSMLITEPAEPGSIVDEAIQKFGLISEE